MKGYASSNSLFKTVQTGTEINWLFGYRLFKEGSTHITHGDTKKRELFKNPTRIEEIQEKKFIDRNWTITTCLLKDSNPNDQCLKIMSCRWRPPPCMHSFTVTTHFKSSRSFVSPCVCCMLCRMRLCRILQSMQHTQVAGGRQHRGCIIPQAVTHSLVLLKMGKITARKTLSCLELLINRYCCISLVVYIIYISLYFFETC